MISTEIHRLTDDEFKKLRPGEGKFLYGVVRLDPAVLKGTTREERIEQVVLMLTGLGDALAKTPEILHGVDDE